MRFGSVCSGIEAASVAWNPLGWRAAWLSEIEPFPAAVLAHHYPDVPNLGDMTTLPARIASGEVDAPDVFCGGTPCQAFSVAGLRKSLDDARGNLSLTFCEIANEIDTRRLNDGDVPCIIFWENVPGVLNTKDNAFGCFLAGLAGEDDPLIAPGGKWTNAGCVFGPKRTVAWRVLDAQYFGVAQRRRRVFVVASARDGFDPAKVLFEFDGVRRDIAPSREAREGATASSTSRAGVGRQQQHYACGGIGSYHSSSASATLLKTGQDLGPGCEAIITMAHGQGGAEIATDRSPTLTCNHEAPIAAYGIPGNWIGRKPENGGNAVEPMHNVAPCLTSTDRHGVAVGAACYNGSLTGDVACTMGTPGSSVNASGPTVMTPIGFQPGNLVRGSGPSPSSEVFGTLISSHGRGSTDQFPHVAIPLAFPANLSGTQCASSENLSPALGAANPTAVAFGVTIHGTHPTVQKIASYDEIAQCLRARTPGNIDNSSTSVVMQPVADANSPPPAVFYPVRYGHHQQDTLHHEAGIMSTLPSGSNNNVGHYTATVQAMQVRRLTPEECEALQGFPTVSEKITIQACLDHQNQSVRVALKCLRWQNSALSAEESALTQPAKTAAVPSSTSPAHLAPLAALHVRMHSVDELLEIRSAGRLIWSASGAGQSRKSLPPTLTENSVQELARLLREVARTITAGKAESPPSIRLSFPASSGAINAEKSGREMEESASDAMSDQHRATFTTSDLGLITTFSDSTAETLSCFALHAIAGCIPSTTLPETFSIEITVETPYTAIPWRKKPASDCPDGPRYKALGNSWAVPVVRWIGERIGDELARIQAEKPAANDPQINQHALF